MGAIFMDTKPSEQPQSLPTKIYMFVLERKIDAFVTYDHEANWFTCRTRAGRQKSSSHNRHDLQDVEVHIRAESEGVSYITLKSGERDLVLSNQRCLPSKRFGSFTFIWNATYQLDVKADYMAQFEKFAIVESPETGSKPAGTKRLRVRLTRS
ncbi:uncharacterized protein LOC120430575 [Culex pipiens pallens]|uniref:uncharacterized protein LOC120430575 n=1 Tax=Culex pipiens pallens TaxID=42434 RepID=UPI0019541629|nr:uncharacterized protein LOC120430575 [Culex pipiens pallens]